MRNILILTPFHFPNQGGAESFIDALEKEASECFNLTVLTFHPFDQLAKNYEEYTYKNGSLKIHRLRWWVKQSKAWQGVSLRNGISVIPSMALSSYLLMRKNRYDVIHSQGLLSGFVGYFLKKIFRKRHLITLLALYRLRGWKNKVVSVILKDADCVFVEGQRGRLNALGMGAVKIKIFTHWCDHDEFKPNTNKKTTHTRVLFVGRPLSIKGIDIVRVAEKVLKDYCKDKEYEFTYVTDVKHSDLPKIYSSHDILVVPSLYDEGYSRVVVEGVCCGLTVIVSNRGSLPEQVREFGYVIEPHPENLKNLLIKLSVESQSTPVRAGKPHPRYTQLQNPRNLYTPKNAEVFLYEYIN